MRPAVVELVAPAKLNLTLHVLGRRADGYHLLDSLVVFAGVGDRIRLRRAASTTLSVSGPFAGSVPAGEDNLVLRAARLAGVEAEIALEKLLPVGAGIGGGSSDAAAVLRGVSAMTGVALPETVGLGADVPVCLAGRPVRMGGIGERLEGLSALPDLPVVIVHPGVAVPTASVFSALASRAGAPMPPQIPHWQTAADAAAWLSLQRNDLEHAALGIAPVIATARSALEEVGP